MSQRADDHRTLSVEPPPRSGGRGDLWFAGAIVAAFAVYAVAYLWLWLPGFDGDNDFFVLWSAGRWVADRGFDPGVYDYDAMRAFQAALVDGRFAPLTRPFAYPPHGLFVFAPFGQLALGPALAAFLGVGLAIFLALAAWGRPVRALALAASPASLLNVVIGQIAFLTAGLLVGGLRLAVRHPVFAGILIGGLTIKPQLGLVVPFALAAAGRWLCLASAAATALALLGASLALGGTAMWEAWLALLPRFAADTAVNIDSTLRLMVTPTAALIGLGLDPYAARLVQLAIAAVVVAVVWRACRRSGLTEMTIALACVGTLLATPFAFFYDLTLAAFAAAVLAEHALRSGAWTGERAVVLLAWALPVLAAVRGVPAVVAPVALALLFVAILRRVGATDAAATARLARGRNSG